MNYRSRRTFLAAMLVVPLAGSGAFAPSVQAATTPAVTFVQIVDKAPGGLMAATGTGFAPGVPVDVTFDGDDMSVKLATVPADATGAVTLPDGTYSPSTAAPGIYHLTMTQAGSAPVSSGDVKLVAPAADGLMSLYPGWPVDPAGRNYIFPVGLADSPAVVRTVTIDGQSVPVGWYGDDRAFSNFCIGFAVPADLAEGPHQVTFTQTGATPFTASWTVHVWPPTVSVYRQPVPATGDLPIIVTSGRDLDDFDLTVVGAAGDVHAGLRLGDTLGTPMLHVDHLSAGTATISAVHQFT